MKTDKEILIDIFQQQIDKVLAVKGSAYAKLCAAELKLVLNKFKSGELTMEETAKQFTRVEQDYMTMAWSGMSDKRAWVS
jgi:hypothetical protein